MANVFKPGPRTYVAVSNLEKEPTMQLDEEAGMAVKQTAAERIKKLDSERAQILDEALGRARETVAELNSLGLKYDLVDGATPQKKARGMRKGSTVEPKYRDPENPSLTWTGRGRMPKWLQERVDAGGNKDDFKIE